MPVFDEINTSDIELRRVAAKIALRKIEGLKLYRPSPFQQAFHDSMAPERLVRGGNRSGKTTGAVVEVAKAVTNQDPLNRYPKEGVCYCVAKDNDVLAQVMFAKLFKPGAFLMIRDLATKEWRTFDPTNPDDVGREKDVRPATPLISARFVEKIAWERKAEGIPSVATLTTGWKIYFYSANSTPPPGTAIDLALFDEEVADWYAEIAARLIDRSGRFIWSATPQAGTERLYSLHERATAQGGVWVAGEWTGEDKRKDKDKPRAIEEFVCTIDDNKYLTEAKKDLVKEKFAEDEENYRVRIAGEYAILSGAIFPEYSSRLHEVDPFPIPAHWTRYLAVDPGVQVCAVPFIAVPPPDEDDCVYLYDELYIRNCNASIFGAEMARKQGVQTFQTFLIDMRGARARQMGSGLKVVQQYSDALKENKVKSVETGYEFIPGNDNIMAGIGAISLWLIARQDGVPKLQVFRNLENFKKEMRHYRRSKKRGADGQMRFVDEPDKNCASHLIDGLRYLVQYNPQWIPPKERKSETGGAIARWRKMKKEKAAKEGGGFLLGSRTT